MTPPCLMTYVQAAAMVGLSQWALRRAAARRTPAAKRLRTVRVGHRTVKIRTADLLEWQERCANFSL